MPRSLARRRRSSRASLPAPTCWSRTSHLARRCSASSTWSRLQRLNPRLVACSITAYGKRGPWKDEPPIEDLVLARTGLLSGMPGFRPAPVHVVHPLPSVGAALFAANGIAAALLARETTGRGRAVETSLMAGALLYQTKVTGERLDRHVFQTHPSGSAPFYSIYPCADGQWVQLGCVHIGFITTCAKVLGIGELIAEPRFKIGQGGAAPQDDAELRATLTRILQSKPYAEWAAAFEAADVPFAPARLTEDGPERPPGAAQPHGHDAGRSGRRAGDADGRADPPERDAGPRRRSTARARRWPPRTCRSSRRPPKRPASSGADATDPPPLAGVRILEITNLIAGPTAGRILADLGADVIKLEPPGGDMSRPIARTYFYCVNFNKRSISVDTSTDAGKSIVQRIAASADALIANLRPHATARMGVGPAVNPRLIETHMTGYGWTGPYAKRPGIDPLAQALMGMSRAQGGPDNPPVFPAQLAPTDYTNGAMGALGTILALYRARPLRRRAARRQRPAGRRHRAELGLVHALCGQARAAAGRQGPIRALTVPSPLSRCGTAGSTSWPRAMRQRRALCATVRSRHAGASALEPTPGRHPNATSFAVEAGGGRCAALRGRDAGGVAGRGRAVHRGAGGRQRDLPRRSPRRRQRHGRGAPAPQGRQACGSPGSWSSSATRTRSAGLPTPLLGEHTAQVLREIGCSDAEIRGLHADGVVKTEAA